MKYKIMELEHPTGQWEICLWTTCPNPVTMKGSIRCLTTADHLGKRLFDSHKEAADYLTSKASLVCPQRTPGCRSTSF